MGAVRINQSRACVITEGEMLKFLGCLLVALGAVLSIPMEMTTMRPEATTEDTSGRLLSLPVPEKCANRPKHFEHGGHSYWFSGDEENFTDHKVDWLDGRNICREYCMDLVSLETPTENELIEDFLVKNDLPYIWSSGRLELPAVVLHRPQDPVRGEERQPA